MKISGHSPESLRVDAEVLGETVSEVIGPSPLDFIGVDESDIKAIAPQSSDVTIEGTQYQRSWYNDPATDLQKPITITYGFALQASIDTSGTRANTVLLDNGDYGGNRLEFTDVQKSSTIEIFNAISEYTNITFEEASSNENILLFSSKLTGNVAGLAILPSYGDSRNRTQESGSIIINNTDNTTGATLGDDKYERGGALFSTIVHEIGHALGLKHPHDSEADSNDFKFNNGDMRLSATNSVMSYKELAVMRYVESLADGTVSISQRHAKSFQHLDVLALQSVYGISAGGGHTEVNLEALWDKDRDNGGMQEVVSDLGGKDTVKGHSSRPNLINLQSGSVSDIGYGHSLWLGVANGVNLGVPLGIVSGSLPIDVDLLERIYKGKYNLTLAANSIFENAKGGSADDELLGNHYNNELSGLNGNDKLHGFDGNDKLMGGDGNDVLDGGKGSDTLDGGSGQDVASFATSVAGVHVSLSSKTATTENGKDTLTGIEGVIGSDYNDTIIGDTLANVLVGGKGHDVIHGGAGDDTLDGSADSIGVAFGGQVNNLQKLLPNTAQNSNNFGSNIVIEGNILMVGDADAHGGEGRVYVFARLDGEWVYKQTLSNNSLPKFGKSLAIEDGLLVVGSERDVNINSQPSVEYAFYHLNNLQQFTNVAYNVLSTGGGEQVSISRNVSHTGTGQGFHFVHKVSKPGEEVKIYIQLLKFDDNTVSNTSNSFSTLPYRNFLLSDNLLLYGTPQNAATVYDLNTTNAQSISGFISPRGWDSNLKVSSTLSQSAVEMGRAFAIYNNILATAAIKTKAPTAATSQHWETASGLIQVFRKEGSKWIQEALIFDTSVTANDKFGTSIALTEIDSSELMAVGAPDGGRVYIYRYEGESGWVLKSIISKPQDSITGFGKKLAFDSGGTLIVSTDNGVYSYVHKEWAPFHEKESDNAGDRLFGGDGNDTLINTEKSSDIFDGGSGTDAVIFHGYRGDYTIARHNDGFVVVTKGDAVDNLYAIEKLIFWDQELLTSTITASTTDTKAPSIALGEAEKSSSTIQIPIKSNEKGLLYALVAEESANPSQEDIRIQGQHVKVENNNSYYTFKFNNLSPATNYKIHVVAEDNAGNTKVEESLVKTTSTALSKTPETTLLANDNILEVKFALTSQAKVYYAYYNTASSTPPTDSDLKNQPSDAFQHGIAWVEKSYQEQVIHIIGVKDHTTKKLYIYFDGSDEVFELDTPQSLEDTSIIGLATDYHHFSSHSDWI